MSITENKEGFRISDNLRKAQEDYKSRKPVDAHCLNDSEFDLFTQQISPMNVGTIVSAVIRIIVPTSKQTK